MFIEGVRSVFLFSILVLLFSLSACGGAGQETGTIYSQIAGESIRPLKAGDTYTYSEHISYLSGGNTSESSDQYREVITGETVANPEGDACLVTEFFYDLGSGFEAYSTYAIAYLDGNDGSRYYCGYGTGTATARGMRGDSPGMENARIDTWHLRVKKELQTKSPLAVGQTWSTTYNSQTDNVIPSSTTRISECRYEVTEKTTSPGPDGTHATYKIVKNCNGSGSGSSFTYTFTSQLIDYFDPVVGKSIMGSLTDTSNNSNSGISVYTQNWNLTGYTHGQ